MKLILDVVALCCVNTVYYRCDDRDLPDLETLSPKVSVQINESDVIDILVDKHGKSDNFIINLDDCNQILLSADSVNLKERVSSV